MLPFTPVLYKTGANLYLYREFAGGVSPLRKRHVNFASRHFEWIRFSHGEELLCGWVP